MTAGCVAPDSSPEMPYAIEVEPEPADLSQIRADDPELIRYGADQDGHTSTIAALTRDFAYTTAHGWYQWTGTIWLNAGGESAAYAAVLHVIKLRREAGGIHKIDILANLRITDSLIKSVLSMWSHRVIRDLSEFDAHPNLLTAINGIIDLRTGQLLSHQRDYMLTRCISVAYKPQTACYLDWSMFFGRTVGADQEAWLKLCAGYSVTGEICEEAMFYIYGPTRAGKGVFTEALRALLPAPLCVEADFVSFTRDRSNDANNFDLAQLSAARLVIASESERGDRLNASKIKQMTGGNAVRCCYKYGDHFEYQPRFKVWLVSNHPVNAAADDDAVWGRVRVLSFPNSFAGHEDTELKTKMHDTEHLEGLLLWLVEGARAWYKLHRSGQRLTEPDDRAADKLSMRYDADTVRQWLDEATESLSGYSAAVADLYSSYADYCRQSGYRPMGKSRLSADLIRRGYKRARTGSAHLIDGIRLCHLVAVAPTTRNRYGDEL